MAFGRKIYLIAGLTALGAIIAGLLTLGLLPLGQQPQPPPTKDYDYYQVIDMENEQTLMYVPLKVSIGDEVISEENKRYQVVRIEENRAYARFVEYVNLEKYSPENRP